METIININSLKSGDHKAYESLFRSYYAPLCNYAYSILQDSDEAKDIVQKTFCTLWDQRETIEIHTSVKSYMYRVVHNNCMNRIKQYTIRSEHNLNYVYGKDELSNNTETGLLVSELEQQVNKAIESMPPRCREVFILSRHEQLSYAEIAQKLNITTNTVETQIVKALRLLRAGLKDYLGLLLLFVIFKLL